MTDIKALLEEVRAIRRDLAPLPPADPAKPDLERWSDGTPKDPGWNDAEIIERGVADQRYFEENRGAVLAAMKRTENAKRAKREAEELENSNRRAVAEWAEREKRIAERQKKQ